MEERYLQNQTVFITGASRGIGKSIALKAASLGANVVITGKTTETHPQLPGTIYSTAAEIKATGGKCLAIPMDVRFEDQVQLAVEKTTATFGGIDILVNNASAISLTNVESTPMKKVDLLWQVNMRGTYLCSKLCLPLLKKSANSHILTLCPPLNLAPKWFKQHTAYTISKYGMGLCVLGLAEELKAEAVKVNALWPATIIQTAALQAIGPLDKMEGLRSPAIVAEAACIIFRKKHPLFTGQFLIDENVLREEGITDFTPYELHPGRPLLKDLFLE